MKRAMGQSMVLLLLSAVAAVGVHFWHPMAPAWYLVVAPMQEDEVTVALAACVSAIGPDDSSTVGRAGC